MFRPLLAAAVLALSAAPAGAEVVSRTTDSFTLRYAVAVEIAPDDIAPALAALPQWWDPAHTYSGSASNLSLDLTPGGCWCEKLPDGTAFDHGRTVSVGPDSFVFSAPFGPMRGKTTKAELTVTWPAANRGWTPTWMMVVEGPGIGAMADGVDAVMGAGYQRWLYYLEYGEAPAPSA
ncbi:hypothetical protein GGQ87_000920 [Brevundimonas alba]|uniref:ATPase n=1 Tax=Brevundimonas alba TaxID=74314 RepID=A0A7X5YIP8_9CAUL|nr:hypothetical protein [Brevundimonas alba]NJC40662.1 hypothetical protein [Brevundimonas alba]